MRNFFLLTTFLALITAGQIAAQSNAQLRKNYIEQYKDLAISEMQKSGIPASITMAQAVLESDNGQSDLATTAKNHFGIKCHKTWDGRRFYYDDDEINDCFRAYRRVEESYRDHSLFLMTRDRYAFLFDLNPTDYKAWARGLKKAGYATNPKYADLLIKIVEENELYKLDHMIPSMDDFQGEQILASNPNNLPESIEKQNIYTRNRIKFIVAEKEDNIETIAENYDKFKWEIRRYNEIPRGGDIQAGQIVYLQPKRKRAARGFDIHQVGPGETWYSIAQHYGIKLKWLYKRNASQPGVPVDLGDRLFLRGKKKEAAD